MKLESYNDWYPVVMIDEVDRFITVSLRSGAADCPSLTLKWMDMHGIRYTDSEYKRLLQKMNKHMRSLEKYDIVRYTGKVVSSNIRAKIWELVLNEE